MKIFGTLYRTELKKILSKKAIYITFIVGFAFISLVELSNMLFDNHDFPDGKKTGVEYEMYEREVGEKKTGLKMDDDFYESMRRELLEYQENHKDEIQEIKKDGEDYDEIWYASDRTGNNWLLSKEYRSLSHDIDRMDLLLKGSAAQISEAKRNLIISNMEENKLTEAEIEYWLDQYDKIEKPFVYSYANGYSSFYACLLVIIWLVFMIIIIGLSGVFADENSYKTDALILSSRYGRGKICLAKLIAGITFSVGTALFVLSLCLAMPLIAWGGKGWNTPIQNILPACTHNLTIGESIYLIFGLGITVSILFGIFTMMLSHIFRNTTPVLAIQIGILLISIFEVPYRYVGLTKIWMIRLVSILRERSFVFDRLYIFSGIKLNCFQMAGIIYSILFIIFFIMTIEMYRKSEVRSR